MTLINDEGNSSRALHWMITVISSRQSNVCSIVVFAHMIPMTDEHSLPLVDKKYPCSGKGAVSGIDQFTHSGVVHKTSDEQHEACKRKGQFQQEELQIQSRRRRVLMLVEPVLDLNYLEPLQ